MAQQTLFRSPQQAAEQTAEQTRKQRRKQTPRLPAGHRTTSTPNARSRSRNGTWLRGVAGLVVALVLSLLAGVLLAVHGPASSPADRPATALQPENPTGPKPAPPKPATPATPATPEKSTKPGTAKAKPTSAKKVTLRPGDTLWALARTHGTTVKELQRLNGLGRSTMIYAGHTLRVPAKPDAAGSARQAGVTPTTVHTLSKRPSVKPATAVSAPSAAIAYAKAQLGKPYVWGGTGPRSFDCSGLVMRAWQAAGVTLPRTTADQIHAGTATTRDRLVPGDLVLAYGGAHVELYIGKGQVVHAPRPGTRVTKAPLPDPRYIVAYRHIRT